MAKEAHLPTMELQSIPELTEAAENYAEVRDKRIKLLAKELELKEKVGDLMKEHKLTSYRDDDLTITLETKEKIKVKIESGENEAEEGEAA